MADETKPTNQNIDQAGARRDPRDRDSGFARPDVPAEGTPAVPPGMTATPGPFRGDEQDMTDLRRNEAAGRPAPAPGAPTDYEDEDLDAFPANPASVANTNIPPIAHNPPTTTPAHGSTSDLHHNEHRDPISGEPGAHPVGAGIGAAAGGAAAGFAVGGAMIGTGVGGPVGTALGAALGAAVGGLVGGYAGKGIAESINPTDEDAYWRDNYRSRPYVNEDADYDQYGRAYQHGWESRAKYHDRDWNAAEADVRRDWEEGRSDAGMTWDRARHAVRDAWDRVTHRQRHGPKKS